MARAIGLHIGINTVDPRYYQGWDGKLNACESDAKDMLALSKKLGYKSKTLLTKQATSANVIKHLMAAAKVLQPGDSLLLTYSGHGGQIPDTNGDEEDRKDETWVLHDRMLIDDELYNIFGKFKAGVRITMLSDSCHSGTVSRAAVFSQLAVGYKDLVKKAKSKGKKLYEEEEEEGPKEYRYRICPREVCEKVYKKNKKQYNEIAKKTPRGDFNAVVASIILISGCQDNQLSLDGDHNGLFTENLLAVWDDGRFEGDFKAFHTAIQKRLPPYQSPNLFTAGKLSPEHYASKPFVLPGQMTKEEEADLKDFV